MRLRTAFLAALAAALALAQGEARAEPLKIRFGWVVAPATVVPLISAKPDLARHMGKSYTLELTHFEGSPTLGTALGSGELDIGTLAFSSFGSLVVNGGMDDLRVVAGEVEDGQPGYNTNEFMVLKDGPIRTIEDLKGKVVATNVFGAAVDIAIRVMMGRHHLADKTDYTMIEVPFPNMKAFLLDGKVALVTEVEPFSMDPQLRASARTLFTERDALGVSLLSFWTARQGFLAKNRAAVVDFMEDFLRLLGWLEDQANHREAVAILAGFLKQPPERLDWAFTKADQYRNPKGLPNLEALQRNLRDQQAVGYLKGEVDVKRLADLSLIEDAAKRLH